MSPPYSTPARLNVGDTVELRDAAFDTVGTAVALVGEDQVKVEWNTGQGLIGKTTSSRRARCGSGAMTDRRQEKQG